MGRSFSWSTGALLVMALIASGCVVQSRFVTTRDALVREQAGHHETTRQLANTGERLIAAQSERDAALQKLRAQEQEIRSDEQRISQLELDAEVAEQKRDEAAQLVEQLRDELERVADHLRAFSDQRDALKTALEAAEARVQRLAEVEQEADERAVLVRDLALALHRPVATGEAELAVVDGRPVLRLPTTQIFPGDTADSVTSDGAAMLAAVARVASAHPDVAIHLTEAGTATAPGAPEARLGRVSSCLVEHGVARSQILVDVPPVERAKLAEALGEAEPGRIELELYVATGSKPLERS